MIVLRPPLIKAIILVTAITDLAQKARRHGRLHDLPTDAQVDESVDESSAPNALTRT